MKHKKYQIAGWALAAMLLTSVMAPATTWAWGPERPTYTMAAPADHATFNSITDNPAVGDERNFVRVAEKKEDGSAVYRDDITIEAGKQYEVYIYFHNDASETVNDAAHNRAGYAWNTRLSSSYPHALKAGERGTIVGMITSTSTQPEAVWDEAYITAAEAMRIEYVLASAKIYPDKKWETYGAVLPSTLFSEKGTFLGLIELNGVIPGCDQYSGQVVYTLQTYAVETEEPKPDPEPEPEPTPDPEPTPEPETPTELPTTGPAEIILAVVVSLALVAGVVYWWRSSHAVRKATKRAKGRK